MRLMYSVACAASLVMALGVMTGCLEQDTKGTPTGGASTGGTIKPTNPNDLSGVVASNTAVKEIPPTPFKNHWSKTAPSPGKKINFGPYLKRNARRINFFKLRQSIPVLFGGMTWVDGNGANRFDQLASTLGRADYIQVNKDNDEVTKLFMKLMNDMALNVCSRAVANDYKLTGSNASKRVFARYQGANEVLQNLRFVRLKFHGVYVPDNSTDGLQGLQTLYNGVLASKTAKGDKQKAWELVCVAMLTSPEFYVY